jgi:aromatic ring-cleaving dioxygenase
MNNPDSSGVWLFHSHAYFDHAVPERVTEARAFMEQVEEVFATDTHVNPSRFHPAPAGPHPCGNFEVVFTREAFTRYVSWLMFARPERIDILIHPLTGSHALDHTARGLWLGSSIALDRAMLEAEDAKSQPHSSR